MHLLSIQSVEIPVVVMENTIDFGAAMVLYGGF